MHSCYAWTIVKHYNRSRGHLIFHVHSALLLFIPQSWRLSSSGPCIWSTWEECSSTRCRSSVDKVAGFEPWQEPRIYNNKPFIKINIFLDLPPQQLGWEGLSSLSLNTKVVRLCFSCVEFKLRQLIKFPRVEIQHFEQLATTCLDLPGERYSLLVDLNMSCWILVEIN